MITEVTSTENLLSFKELTFDAAHYIPGHPKCSVLHGHTYIIRNLEIYVDDFVDFGDIKEVIRGWDHTTIVPERYVVIWLNEIAPLLEKVGASLKIRHVESTTVECIGETIQKELMSLKHVVGCTFKIYEGQNQGVKRVL